MFRYGFDKTNTGKSPVLRRIIIGACVTAVTLGLLYLLVPNDMLPEFLKKNTADTQSANNGETPKPEDSSQSTPEDKTSTDTQSTTAEGGTLTPNETENGAESNATEEQTGEKSEEKQPESTETTTGESQANEPTDYPEKGKPWKGDAPEPPKVPESQYSDAQKVASQRVQQLLTAVNEKKLTLPEAVTFKVKNGDNLTLLARRYHTTTDGLKVWNKRKTDRILLGAKMTVLPGPWLVKVVKSERRLYVYRGENPEPYLMFDVGIGRLDKTPTADFVICVRQFHPAWYAPDGAVYQYGDPQNVLGDYFLKLSARNSDKPLNGFGIHGTQDESAIRQAVTSGCVRMRNREVELLYYLLPLGTQVKIEN